MLMQLFSTSHSDGYWVGYESLPITTDLYHKITCFDLNIMGIVVLDFIAVDSEHQGKGYGDSSMVLLNALQNHWVVLVFV